MPSFSVKAAICSPVARSPKIAVTGSIGITRDMKKVTAKRPIKVMNKENNVFALWRAKRSAAEDWAAASDGWALVTGAMGVARAG